MNKELIVRESNRLKDLLEEPKMKTRLRMALPKHLDEERLIRTVMTAVRMNPALLDCSKESFLAAVMACAQLGLEPEPFLGQAYLVPFKNQVVFIPGYRGYIALARRSGEVQSVSAQVVYENDYFQLQYGTDEKLEHRPTDGDRGRPKGAYVIFKYKDGGHSFDFMTVDDINKVRDNFSKQPQGLMWKENWPEAAKKTVIRRHVKLVPLAVEIQRAAALEDRFYGGESQFDIVFPEPDERKGLPGKDFWTAVDEHFKGRPQPDKKRLQKFIEITAVGNEKTTDEVMEAAANNIESFMSGYFSWVMKESGKEREKDELPFANLKKPGLIKWEEQNRDKITSMPVETQTAFLTKWHKVMGEPYNLYLASLDQGEEQSETSPQASEDELSGELIVCPDTEEEMAPKYCNEVCKKREGCSEWD